MKALYAIIAAASMLGCSNGDNTTDGGNDATSADVSPDVIIDPQNCIPPGTKPNDQGMGGYCSPGGGQCDKAGPGGAPRICTADVGGTPQHAWFCTYPCDPSFNCGSGAQCVTNAQGSGCVPVACFYLAGDGGLDSGSDASDAAPDVLADVSKD